MRHVIALDVGGTGMKAALVGAEGELLHRARRATGRERGPDAVVEHILDFAAELRAYGEEQYGEPASAAGVAVPGIVDAERGIAAYSANLGWRDVPLRDLLAARLGGVPVALGHDVRTGGLAEGRIGAGKGADRFLFVPLGTGIAGAIGIDGRVEAGAHGFAGEVGHIVVRPGGLRCPCGQTGCLERYASAAAVTEAWATASATPRRTRPTAPRPSTPPTRSPRPSGTRRSTPSPTASSPPSPSWTPARSSSVAAWRRRGKPCSHPYAKRSAAGSPSKNCRRSSRRPWGTRLDAWAQAYWLGISSTQPTARR